MKVGGGSKIVETNRSRKEVEKSRKKSVESFAIRSPLHSSSSSQCAKRKVYNEKI
jgi:hypothetical protein